MVIPDPRQWVQKHADHLYTYALARLADEHLARDLVQETFLAALQKVDLFRGQSSERTWLTAILKYKVIDVYRKRSSGLQVTRVDPEPELEFFEAENGHWKEADAPKAFDLEATDPTLRKEMAAILQKCLQKLPTLWLSIFSMKHMDELPSDTICKELKITSANFWVIVHRAKLNLRACIQKEGL
ncbi:sigma-70 family RNA polymerase sigma factor [Puia sp.]|jgi:RNA polymerase sigma-70 factor (ECF subfamily)|uniref:sigma-70 family RNA polymerase sigma factor n=1 Tax=Puia sp. TaxID=2045100 RepID=UPI002F409145